MRPSGGYTPEMLNFSRETDVYKIWADMIAFDKTDKPLGEHHYCACAGVRDNVEYKFSRNDILEKYEKNLKLDTRLPEAIAVAMGNQMYIANFETLEEVKEFFSDLTEPAGETASEEKKS